MEITLTKKQQDLKSDIIAQFIREIYVLGSTQSGKTFDICLGVIEYAQVLHKYDSKKRYTGAIVGWSEETLLGNIVEVLEELLNKLGYVKKVGRSKGDYVLKFGGKDKYLQIRNVKFFFFGFNNKLAFNKILGKPLIFLWIDESARIYTEKQLQKSFNEFPARQISFVEHPLKKTIHSFNVEGGENHDYKVDILDKKPNAKHYMFYPSDNPILNTKEAIVEVVNTFAPGALREQKIYNRWTVAEGKVFNNITTIEKDDLKDYIIREIGIGIDYGSVNATTFVPKAIAYNTKLKRWELLRLNIYYHDSKTLNDNPTTEYFSKQLRFFLLYLKKEYGDIPLYDIVIDSEATHFINRLEADNIPHVGAKKGAGSVNKGVEYMQSLMYKGYYKVLKSDNIRHFNTLDNYDTCKKDDGLIELESYQYDRLRSEKEGKNCYIKDKDHSIDADRYLNELWAEKGKLPIV